MTAGDVVLAYLPSPSQGVWHLGPVPVRAYALWIIVGIVVAVWWGGRRWKARGGQVEDVLDVALIAVPFGLIGGRIYHVLTDWWRYFGDGGKGFGAVFQVWDGGLGIWGAVALGAVGAWIGCRWKGIKLPPFGDALAPAILLAQGIGRIGNYFNQELYGETTTLPWGLELFERVNPDTGRTGVAVIDGVSNGTVVAVVHPTFLYELLWNLFVVALLVFIDRRWQIGHGRLFALYVAGYCVGRFGIELMRTDEATEVFGLRINVLVAALVFLGAVVYVVVAPRGRETGLSMYWPKRAAELAEEGEVGYVPPTLNDPVEYKDTGEVDTDEEYVDGNLDELELDADDDFDDGGFDEVDADEAADLVDDERAADDAGDPVDSKAALDEDAVDQEAGDTVAAEKDAVDAAPADEALADEADTAAESEAAESEAAEPEVEDTDAAPTASGLGYTLTSSSTGLEAITVVEQNPGGAAGAIEIRSAEPNSLSGEESDTDRKK